MVVDGTPEEDLIFCPFCGQSGYDCYGLKLHLTVFGCETMDRCTPENPNGEPEQ